MHRLGMAVCVCAVLVACSLPPALPRYHPAPAAPVPTAPAGSAPSAGFPDRAPSPVTPALGVVRLSTPGAVGSGFYITEHMIATNAHVVAGVQRLRVAVSDGVPFDGDVIYRDAALDFAIVKVEVSGTPLELRKRPIADGETVTALGYPQGRTHVALSTGTVRGRTAMFVVHDALIAGGSSGGPLVDEDGFVIGLNTLLRKRPNDRKNEFDRTFAIKLSVIRKSLRDW